MSRERIHGELAQTLPENPPMTRTSLRSMLVRMLARALVGAAVGVTVTTAARATVTESTSPVDVALHDAPRPHRLLTVEWNPLALFIDRFSVSVVVVPQDHHALVLSPFYTWASTSPYATNIDASGDYLVDANGNQYTLNVPSQTFKGFGGELGYRYYFDRGGPRGFFLGPSLLLASITATAGNGSQTSFVDLGVAADAGYEALIADTIAVSVGAGVQYSTPSKSIPDQQLPASIVANSAVLPRLLLSVGYAF